MHILDTTLFYAPHSGGVKRYLHEKRRCLTQMDGISHTLLVPGPRDALIAGGIATLACPRLPGRAGYRWPLRRKAWRDALLTLAPDVIEVGDPYLPAVASIEAAARMGIPALAFAHSDLPRLLGRYLGRSGVRGAEAWLRRLYARFDAVLAPSRVIAARLAAAGIANIEVQPLGVDAEAFHPARADADLRAELGLPARARLLLFAGRLAAEKNIPMLRAAVGRLGAPYHLLLVGGATARRLDAHTTVLPYEPDTARLARLYASCDALLHAGTQETFGMVVLEAFACARPVVAVPAGALPELVDAEVGVLARAVTAEALAEAITALYACDRGALGAAARARVERDYAWPRVIAQQLALYRALRQSPRIATAAAAGAPL
jgi:alpha-1,6-mannosyltransferase